jgi:hypothetical protein
MYAIEQKGGWVWWGMIPIEASIALSFSLNYCNSNLICGHERFEKERLPFLSLFIYMRKPKLALKAKGIKEGDRRRRRWWR